MKQMNVRLSEELKKQVKMRCFEEDKSFNQVVTELLTQWVGEAKVETPPQEYKPVPLQMEEPKKDSRDDVDSWFTPVKWK